MSSTESSAPVSPLALKKTITRAGYSAFQTQQTWSQLPFNCEFLFISRDEAPLT